MGSTSSRDEDAALLLAVPPHTKVGKRRFLDSKSGRCTVCQKSFNLCNKKHYCRRCGNIVCDMCTTMRHYKQRTGHRFRVCEHCNVIPIIHRIPQKLWHLIVSFCGNVAHHHTIQVCRKMQLTVPLPFPWGDSWDYFFTEGHFLSKGANGSVYKTTLRSDPRRTPVAVKVIQKSTIFSLRKWHHIHREIEAMRVCKHPNVVELVTVVQNPESVFIVLQYAHGGDLFDWLVSRKHPSEIEVKPIAIQLLSTIAYMHDGCGCVHRDIKPENILLEKKVRNGDVPHIRLADFGFARVFPQLARSIGAPLVVGSARARMLAELDVSVAATPCGTLGFAAPEIIDAYSTRKEAIRQVEEELLKKKPQSPVSPKVINSPITPVELMKKMDIFAAGVTFCILLTGCEPFPCHSSKAHLDAVREGANFHGRQWSHVSAEAKDILRRMLDPSAAKRPSAMECLQSRWLTGPGRTSSARAEASPALASAASQLLRSKKDDEELAVSFQQSLRSLRKNDGMIVADRSGVVTRMRRQEIVEDTLVDEPPVLPPGPEFRNESLVRQQTVSSGHSNTPNATPRLAAMCINDDDGLDGDME